MLEMLFVRHCPTSWNERGIFQGRTDIPLSEAGKAQASRIVLPSEWQNSVVISSPLSRAQETARIVTGKAPHLFDELVEQNFGSWEGGEIEATKSRQDFCPPTYGWPGWGWAPPEGETYFQVGQRLDTWVRTVAEQYTGQRLTVFTHKGVILVALALAAKWDMNSKRPFKMKEGMGFHLKWSAENGWELVTTSVSLYPSASE